MPAETFRTPINEYREKVLEVAHLLLRILALGLPYAPDIFEEFTFEPVANVRLLHYPPQKSVDEKQLGGKSTHDAENGSADERIQLGHTPTLDVSLFCCNSRIRLVSKSYILRRIAGYLYLLLPIDI